MISVENVYQGWAKILNAFIFTSVYIYTAVWARIEKLYVSKLNLKMN